VASIVQYCGIRALVNPAGIGYNEVRQDKEAAASAAEDIRSLERDDKHYYDIIQGGN
jgi:hypothetical protein